MSANTGPSTSRIRIAGHPLGNTARPSRSVPAGTSPKDTPRNDTASHPKHNVGLFHLNEAEQTDVTTRERIYQQHPAWGAAHRAIHGYSTRAVPHHR